MKRRNVSKEDRKPISDKSLEAFVKLLGKLVAQRWRNSHKAGLHKSTNNKQQIPDTWQVKNAILASKVTE